MFKLLGFFLCITSVFGDVPAPATPPPVDTPMVGPIPAPVPAPGPDMPEVPVPAPRDDETMDPTPAPPGPTPGPGPDMGQPPAPGQTQDPDVIACQVNCNTVVCAEEGAACTANEVCAAVMAAVMMADSPEAEMAAMAPLSQDATAGGLYQAAMECLMGCGRYCGPHESCIDVCMNTKDEDCMFDGGCCDAQFLACWANEDCKNTFNPPGGDGGDGGDGGNQNVKLLMEDDMVIPPYQGPEGPGLDAYNGLVGCVGTCGMDCTVYGMEPVEECSTRCLGGTCVAQVHACGANPTCGATFGASTAGPLPCFGVGYDDLPTGPKELYGAVRDCVEPCITDCLTDIHVGAGADETTAAASAEQQNPYRACDCLADYCTPEIELCETNENCKTHWAGGAGFAICAADPLTRLTGCWNDDVVDEAGETLYQIAYGCAGNCVLNGPQRSCQDFFGYQDGGTVCQAEFQSCSGLCLEVVSIIGSNVTSLEEQGLLLCSANVIATAGDKQAQTNALLDCAAAATAETNVPGQDPITEICDSNFITLADIATCWKECGEPEEEGEYNVCDECDCDDDDSPAPTPESGGEEDISSVSQFCVSLGLLIASLAMLHI